MNKQILEIIEPYMDKTLTFWCRVDVEWYCKIVMNDSEQKNVYECIYEETNEFWFYEIKDIKKILWHYDITAVLKYIGKKVYYINLDCLQEYIEIYKTKDDLIAQEVFWFIPNKPLHLYTEQEEKNLLELLLKLK